MRSTTHIPGWAAVLGAGLVGALIGVGALILLGGREAPEWQAKLLVWVPPAFAIAIYARRRFIANRRKPDKPLS